MPAGRSYDPARDIFTSEDPAPAPPPPPAQLPDQAPASSHIEQHAPSVSSPPSQPNAPAPAQSLSRKRKASSASESSRKPTQRSPVQKRRRAEPKYLYKTSPPPLIPREKEPTPPPAPSRDSSPPRKRKRPGQGARFSDREKAEHLEALRRREEEERRKKEALQEPQKQDVVRSHYNDKKELGKTWRRTDSKIKGLRSFNNWIKSVVIQKFSPAENFNPSYGGGDPRDDLLVLDIGCGKGGDLLKWKLAPQPVQLYVGVDTADVSIAHARDRYESMLREQRRSRGGQRNRQLFDGYFHALDCYQNYLGQIDIINRVGIDAAVGPNASRMQSRFGGGGFDVVSMMFCMHYAFETEAMCRQMLANVSGSLRKGGRFIGTIPSSDVISSKVSSTDEEAEHGVQEWSNSIYRVKFTNPPPKNGVFRPMWGWQYNYFLEEAVEEVPEYVVPWEAFRGLAEDYGLELVWKKAFHQVWEEEKERDRELMLLSERMGVRDREGKLLLGEDEWEACGFYLAFAFKKI